MSDENGENRVIITDIHIPFISLVIFLVKLAIAAIPALIILILLGAISWSVLAGLVLGLHGTY